MMKKWKASTTHETRKEGNGTHATKNLSRECYRSKSIYLLRAYLVVRENIDRLQNGIRERSEILIFVLVSCSGAIFFISSTGGNRNVSVCAGEANVLEAIVVINVSTVLLRIKRNI